MRRGLRTGDFEGVRACKWAISHKRLKELLLELLIVGPICQIRPLSAVRFGAIRRHWTLEFFGSANDPKQISIA